MNISEIKIFSPASVANVSCGFDVLGFCLDTVGDEMIIRKTISPGLKITKIEGQRLPLDIRKNLENWRIHTKSLLNPLQMICVPLLATVHTFWINEIQPLHLRTPS